MTTVTASIVPGNRTAQEYEQIFRDNYRLVYQTAYSILNSPADAEDVLQTVFLRFIRRDVSLENVRGYLYRAAVNLSLDVIESRKRFELTATIDRFEATSEGSESRAAEEVHKRLAEAMTELPLKAVHILSLLLAMWSDHLYSRQWKNNSA